MLAILFPDVITDNSTTVPNIDILKYKQSKEEEKEIKMNYK
jgi:hypothetical protein